MPNKEGTWTDAHVQRLKDLWEQGLSASQIAIALGGVSRNAVIGKVHRLGLSRRVVTGRKTATSTRANKNSTPKVLKPVSLGVPASRGNLAIVTVDAIATRPVPKEEIALAEVVPMARYLTLMQLGAASASATRWMVSRHISPEI